MNFFNQNQSWVCHGGCLTNCFISLSLVHHGGYYRLSSNGWWIIESWNFKTLREFGSWPKLHFTEEEMWNKWLDVFTRDTSLCQNWGLNNSLLTCDLMFFVGLCITEMYRIKSAIMGIRVQYFEFAAAVD